MFFCRLSKNSFKYDPSMSKKKRSKKNLKKPKNAKKKNYVFRLGRVLLNRVFIPKKTSPKTY